MPRSYIIQDENERMLRRNWRDLLQTKEQFLVKVSVDLSDEIPAVVMTTTDSQPVTVQQHPEAKPGMVHQPPDAPGADMPYRTRSGRAVRPPIWFQNYER